MEYCISCKWSIIVTVFWSCALLLPVITDTTAPNDGAIGSNNTSVDINTTRIEAGPAVPKIQQDNSTVPEQTPQKEDRTNDSEPQGEKDLPKNNDSNKEAKDSAEQAQVQESGHLNDTQLIQEQVNKGVQEQENDKENEQAQETDQNKDSEQKIDESAEQNKDTEHVIDTEHIEGLDESSQKKEQVTTDKEGTGDNTEQEQKLPAESFKFGYDNIARSHSDGWTNTVYILHPDDAFAHSGHVTAWHVYSNLTADVIFQLWRPTVTAGDVGGVSCTPSDNEGGTGSSADESKQCVPRFQLLASHSATLYPVGAQIISLPYDQWMAFSPGDLIGMYFPNENPIPFSKQQSCLLKTMYIQDPGELNICGSYVFRQKQDGWNPCRIYSVYAEISNISTGGSAPCPDLPSKTDTNGNHAEETHAPTKLEVKVVNGRVPHEGLVMVREVSTNSLGEWGSICGDGWDDNDAAVVCRQLGYSGGTARFPPFFGSGTGVVYLDNVPCKGSESTLVDCLVKSDDDDAAPSSSALWTNNTCEHSQDAGVECMGTGFASDIPRSFGHPAVSRSHKDTWSPDEIYLLNTQHLFPWKQALLTEWQFYLEGEEQEDTIDLALQVWRYEGLGPGKYRIVSTEEYQDLLPQEHRRHVPQDRQTPLRAGDLLGVQIHTPGGAIPYDVTTYQCPLFHNQMNIMHSTREHSDPKVKVGNVYSFLEKSGDVSGPVGCRMYSLSVSFKPLIVGHQMHIEPPGLGVTVFSSPGVRYELLYQDPGVTHTEAETSCHNREGGMSLLHMTSPQQHAFIMATLNWQGVTGPLWVAGQVNSQSQQHGYLKWGQCQPESGRECIVLKKPWESKEHEFLGTDDDQYYMFTRSCRSKYNYYICQNTTDLNNSSQIDQMNGLNIEEGRHARNALVVAVILVLVVVVLITMAATLICRKYRRNRANGDPYSESSVRFVHLDEKAGL